MRITSGFMTNLSGDNIDSSTGSGIEGGGSREQIRRFGAREEVGRGSREQIGRFGARERRGGGPREQIGRFGARERRGGDTVSKSIRK